MQRLTVENGKLVAYTDNGRYDGENISTTLQGDFIVDAKLVKSLLSEKHSLPLYGEVWRKGSVTIDGFRYVEYLENVVLFNGDEAVYNIIQKHVDARKKAEKEYESLIQAVERFNKKRRFYEREFQLYKYL